MEVQWFSKNKQGIVTLYNTNITLNTIACEYFKNAYSTLIGYNKSEECLLIKPLNKEECLSEKYNDSDLHDISIKPSYGRINGKFIIKHICTFFPLDFSKKNLYKFNCEWDPIQKILKVNLKEEIK